jgi:hypothetical protein
MVFNATFNNISVLLVEETGIPRETQVKGIYKCTYMLCSVCHSDVFLAHLAKGNVSFWHPSVVR